MTRRGNRPPMRILVLLMLTLLAGCAGSSADSESTVAVAADAEDERSESIVHGLAPVDAASDGEFDPEVGGPATVACRSDEVSWTEVEPYFVAGAQIVAGTVWTISAMAELTLFAIQTVGLVAMIIPH